MVTSRPWQSWRNAKGLALLTTLALATGIGSATAIYTVVNAVMLRPLDAAGHVEVIASRIAGAPLGGASGGPVSELGSTGGRMFSRSLIVADMAQWP